MTLTTFSKLFRKALPGFPIFLWLSLTATGDSLSIYKFLTFAISYDLNNPWRAAIIGESTWANGDPGPFVYPIGMYLILIPLRAITYFLGETATEYTPMGASIINLGLTWAIIYTAKFCIKLANVLNAKVLESKILLYVFISPTIAVSFYFGRQLDILPTLFSLMSLVWLLERRYLASASILGIAISLKVYPLLLVLPFVLYLLRDSRDKKESVRRSATFFFVSISIPSLLTFIFYSTEYLNAVVFNPSLGRLFWFKFMLGGSWSPVLIFPVAYTVLNLTAFHNVNNCLTDKRKFTGLTALVLLMPCLLASPMVMWWTWSAPFILVVAITQKKQRSFESLNLGIFRSYLLLGALNLFYSFFDKWSYLTQLAVWYRYPWPLNKSPQEFLEKYIGLDYAELFRQVIFSMQWGLGIFVAYLISRQIFERLELTE